MNHPLTLLFAASAALLALPTGCNKPAPPPPPPQAESPPLPPPTPATVVARLTQPDTPAILPHKVVPATVFPQALASLSPTAAAPEVETPPANENFNDPNRPPTKGLTADGVTTDLVVHDWTGIVLVPLDTSVSTAHTVYVDLDHIEAHPLDNGQVRIWARVKNISGANLPSEVACSFRTAESPEPDAPIFYKLDIPRGDFRDVFFVSPEGRNLNSYTVLVRVGDTTATKSGTLP
jgi:hypothetical protein